MTTFSRKNKSNPFHSLFDWPYAENEEHLSLCFLPPREFNHIRGDSSILVFGESGSGKTALIKALQQESFDDQGKPKRLLVKWRPSPSGDENLNSAYISRRLVLNLLDTCAIALTTHLTKHPQDSNDTPDWALNRLFWFIRYAIQGDLETRLGPILSTDTQAKTLLQSIQNKSLDNMFYEPSPEQTIAEVLIGIKEIGLNGIWVIEDGFEGWAEVDPDSLNRHLKSFLSALVLFEQSGLKFKFVLPANLESQVKKARGATSRRLISFRLEWDSHLLQQVAEKRLALTFNRETFSISDLCSASGFLNWMERTSNTPRQWLEQLKPLVDYYIKHQLKKPIDENTWKKLRFEKLPELWIDESRHSMKVGGREIALDEISPQEYSVLHHLYQHTGEVVGKDGLYFLGYLGLSYIPVELDDKNYASPSEYTGLIDTIIYRLRQAIEPDPSNPILLQTVRGHGIKLASR